LMETVKLHLAEKSRIYSILIGEGLIEEAGRLLQEHQIKGRILIVTNPTVAQWYLQPLLLSLTTAGYQVDYIEIPDGEEYKSLEQANRIYDRLLNDRYDRKTTLIALGGGVIGDLTGFVAATYMRGVRLVQVPTTLLAQVDSSIGGKVAVNHPLGKNMIGAFYQPDVVIADVTTLKTLPPRELSAGMAEVIKHGIILDENYFNLVAAEREAILKLDSNFMTYVVLGSCKIKAAVVEEDEKETGIRAYLNFGHTIGHSLESITNYTRFRHGEAVALGMVAATRIAVKTGLLKDASLIELLEKCLTGLNLPVRIPELAVTAICDSMNLDKKVEYGKLRWVMPKRLGEVEIATDIPLDVVQGVLTEMGAI
jgi:3-dehydroquinate synthase